MDPSVEILFIVKHSKLLFNFSFFKLTKLELLLDCLVPPERKVKHA